MGTAIADVAGALGSLTVTNEALQREQPSWDLEAVQRATGVEARRIAADGETALDLATVACGTLLERNPGLAEAIDLIVFVTQTPDHQVPANVCLLHDRLGLAPSVGAFDLGAACSGYVYGLGVADALLATGRSSHALLVTGETYSALLDPDDRSTRALFGDAATATWLHPTDGPSGLVDVIWATEGAEHGRLETVPASADPPGPVHLRMDGRAILSFTFRAVPDQIGALLARNGLTVDDIDVFLLHQASELVLRSLQDRLDVPPHKVPRRLRTTGNTVSSSIPLLLEDLRASGTVAPGTTVVLAGFGAGLSWASALVRF